MEDRKSAPWVSAVNITWAPVASIDSLECEAVLDSSVMRPMAVLSADLVWRSESRSPLSAALRADGPGLLGMWIPHGLGGIAAASVKNV